MVVLVVVVSPGNCHFQDKEEDNGGDVVLDWQDIPAVLDVKEGP